MSFPTPHSRWRALTTRDPSAKHSFIYSVLTTHIYCRPTCPSRLARRANIVFHDSAAAAEADGFRACKRCRPDSGAGTGGGGEETVLARACRIMRDEKCVRGRELAERVGVSESALYRL
ncbi:metal binding domain of Ada-domain-containing protein, partial [Geopyxis carbonaria]